MTTFIQMYLLTGALACPLLILAEMTVVMNRGPEFMLWLRKNLGEDKPWTPDRALLTVAFWLLLWPLPMLSLLRAGLKKRTLLEHMVLSRQEAQERLEAIEAKRDEAMTRLASLADKVIRREWVEWTFQRPCWAYVTQHGTGSNRTTHMVVQIPGAIINLPGVRVFGLWRLDPLGHEPLTMKPDAIFPQLWMAKEAVENDNEWLAMALPSQDETRKNLWSDLEQRPDG